MDIAMFRRKLREQFDYVGDVVEGMIAVGDGEKFFHYDARTRRPAYKTGFDAVCDFSEGLAAVGLSDDYFHIKKDGTPAYPQRYKDVSDFNDQGLAWVCQEFDAPGAHDDECPRESLWAMINRHGIVVTEWRKILW